ncbi:ecm16p [Saccharomyces arboricola H-6]|uniref:RNA helicase n=1 Tax=Saccharomyces arboricola (strain H-6 / AS 2.3317 / CBS 10644) TaxID=1160507 RepID=J8Q6J0_SACAR|nr:ecm16p [Saccharomyces arboricola H-6]
MGTYRKRFNEKARSGHMAKLKELKKVRNKQFTRQDENDEEIKQPDSDPSQDNVPNSNVNAEILEPLTEEEKKLKKRKLQELFTPKESKVSRLKKKRLDKFIEHQLKREERKTIIDKLQDYKIDTSLLTSSKKLGEGRQTKREEFKEALSLERQGRGSKQVKEILYKEYEPKVWDKDSQTESHDDGEGDIEDDFEATFGGMAEPKEIGEEDKKPSGFIDHRPAKFGGSGFGFGFSNVKVINKGKKTPKKKYNWRQLVAIEEQKRHGKDDEMDFDTSSEDGDEDSSEEQEEYEGEGQEECSENSSEEIEGENDRTESDDTSQKDIANKFKDWANQEIKKMEGRDQDLVTPNLNIDYKPIVRKEDLDDGLKEAYIPINENSTRKAFYVKVNRSHEIQKTRIQLPVFGEEHKIMEAIHHNDVVIICGETGSGKTTQVPQFLYESGFGAEASPDYPGMVGITQPRRVAAVSMAGRVANELGDHGHKVAYQIRFDSTTKEDTKVKFMTDGVLLREMMHDFKLTKYSSIIIDEAHERNINTDILIGMLSRCVRLRAKQHEENPVEHKELKLIIMSATLRVSDFSENKALFPIAPPVLHVDARQFPVSVHFNRRTAFNYTEEAFKKTCKIHQKLPPGAILVFLTGQQEITHMVKRLRKEFPFKKNSKYNKELETPISKVGISSRTTNLEAEDIDFSVRIIDEDKFKSTIEYEDEADNEKDGEEEEEEEEGFEETLTEEQTANDPLYVLPLYSLLPTKEQMRVFQQPPPGSRLCIVATNVAETSLTIPGVRYVVDSGRCKERKFNESNGVQSFEVGWVSKASSNQRSGRAGRTGPGHCYRLYSSAVFEHDFEQFSKPEILRMPVESIVLQMKSMAIHNIVNFPFPTPPDRTALAKAVQLLQYLGALDDKEKISEDGKKMSLFPLSPRFSKMLLVSDEKACVPYIVAIVSILSVGDPFINEFELGINETVRKPKDDEDVDENDRKKVDDSISHMDSELKKELRGKFYKSRAQFSKLDKYSDVFRLLSVVSAMDYIPREQKEIFMKKNFLRGKLMEEIVKLRKQLMYIIQSNISKENVAVVIRNEDLKSDMPSVIQIKLLKQMICSGFVDHVAVRADVLFPDDAKITNRTSMINIPYVPVMAMRTPNIEDCFVYIHPTSILNNLGEMPPKYMIYHSLHLGGNSKTRMNTLCDIASTPLANVARKGLLLTYSKPLTGQGLKTINLSPTERYCYVIPRFGSTVDNDLKIGWDLNPIAVYQQKQNGQWTVIKFITKKSFQSATSEDKKKN